MVWRRRIEVEIMRRVSDNLMETISKQIMDDTWREKIHNQFAPCSNEKFLIEYAKLDPSFESSLWNEYDVDLDDLKEILKTDEENIQEYIVDVTEKYTRSVVVHATSLKEAKSIVQDRINDGHIDIPCDGGLYEYELSLKASVNSKGEK